eukprot:Skav226657  [mRNA]  locus=scaffold2733:184275:185821:+ [translate_table: standard]
MAVKSFSIVADELTGDSLAPGTTVELLEASGGLRVGALGSVQRRAAEESYEARREHAGTAGHGHGWQGGLGVGSDLGYYPVAWWTPQVTFDGTVVTVPAAHLRRALVTAPTAPTAPVVRSWLGFRHLDYVRDAEGRRGGGVEGPGGCLQGGTLQRSLP